MNAPVQLKSLQQQGGEVAKPMTPTKEFSLFMDRMKPQMAAALPAHMKPDRMARLAMTAFSSSREMQECSFKSIASSLMNAGALGLEPGVNGAGFLIPYRGICTFVPGWKGLVDLVSRSGRAAAWTGAVFDGDRFDFELGDRPFVRHRPGDESDPAALTHVYAIGRVNGSEFPIIEVWSMKKVWRHRDEFNKQAGKHYSYRNPEMYARKVPLLQVLKYLPSSVEVANAIALNDAAESGRSAVIDGDFVTVTDADEAGASGQQQGQQQGQQSLGNSPSPTMGSETFATRERAEVLREMSRGEPPAGQFPPDDDDSQAEARSAAAPAFDVKAFEAKMAACREPETLDLMADEIRAMKDPVAVETLNAAYRRYRTALVNAQRPAAPAPRRTGARATGTGE